MYNSSKTKRLFSFVITVIILQIIFTQALSVFLSINSGALKLIHDKQSNINTLIAETVKSDLKNELESIEIRWNIFFQQYPEVSLLEKTDKNKIIYVKPDGTRVVLGKDDKIGYTDDKKNVYNNGVLIHEDIRATWNEKVLSELLNLIALPSQQSYVDSKLTIFDSNTGEVLFNNLEFYNKSEYDGSIDYIYNNISASPSVDNNNALQRVKNVDFGSGIVLSTVDNIPAGSISDFRKYEIGDYNRYFQEKIVLPCEFFGVEGEDMNITIVISIKESQIFTKILDEVKVRDNLLSQKNEIFEMLVYMSFFNIVLVITLVLALLFQIKKCEFNSHQEKNKKG